MLIFVELNYQKSGRLYNLTILRQNSARRLANCPPGFKVDGFLQQVFLNFTR